MTGNFITLSKNYTNNNIFNNVMYNIMTNRSSFQLFTISSLNTNNDKDDKNYIIRTSLSSQRNFNSKNTEALEDSNQKSSCNIKSDCKDAVMYNCLYI